MRPLAVLRPEPGNKATCERIRAGGGIPLALPLFMMSALPIVIAALGWGTRAGILASIVAGAVVAAGLTGLSAASYLANIAFPAVVASHLIGLARTEGDHVEWYPLGHLLLWIAATAALATGARSRPLGS